MADSKVEKVEHSLAAASAGKRILLGKIKTFSSLKNRNYLIYFASNLFQQASQNMQQMTRSLLVYRMTGSATTIAYMSLAGAVPHLFASLFGGVIADRVPKKYVLVFGMLAFSLVALSVAVLLSVGYLTAKTWWVLIINSVLQSSLMGLIVPARSSLVRELVGREGLMNALALNTMGMNGLRLMAPAFAGFAIDFFGFEAVFYIMAGLFAMSSILMIFLPITGKVVSSAKNAIEELTEGLKYIKGERTLLFLLLFTLLGVMLSMPFQQMMPVFVDDILKVGAKGMGMLLSISGIGAIAGAMLFASLPNKRRGLMMLVGTLILGVSLVFFSFSKSYSLSLVIMVIVGVGQTTRMTVSNALVQHYSEDKYRGRVMGVYDMEMAINSLAVYAAAILTETIGVQWAIGGFAILLVIVCILALLFVPRLRKLD